MDDNTKKGIQPNKVKEQLLTYDDYAQLPDDGNRYELVDGVLELMSPSASTLHQLISSQIQYKLVQSCEEEYLILDTPLDVILSPTEVRQPDLIMVHRSRMDIIKQRGIVGAPDLVVEILSPSSMKRDKISKLASYARYSIPEYWIVDPSNGALEQYVMQHKEYKLAEIYISGEPVRSNTIRCASFTMEEVMSKIPDLSDD